MGSRGISPVKKSQSTERLSANSAADPAKIRSTRSGSPQIVRTIELWSTKARAFVITALDDDADVVEMLTMLFTAPLLINGLDDQEVCRQFQPFYGWVLQSVVVPARALS